ncbi:hypothetical protein LTR05_004609 [Lithohypha guttulata]|uniref:Xylanolytic transcriptional activator regulatory domain-containing protein n=1 Tax=Lithohypha guttulata TaxID=1690604 RepID=A0AAN7SZ05_9EURO|nr:hypothetical protein LTR05_004609 [Lithohypha guttulata]
MPGTAFVKPTLLVDNGRTRFISNNLWMSMAEEFGKPGDALDDSSDEEDEAAVLDDGIDFLLGATPNSIGVKDLHPLPEQVMTIWQIFLENVNPLSKLIHIPSMQPVVVEASSHLDNLPKNLEALLFAIYSVAVLTLEPGECEDMLGEKQTVLLARYRNGTKRALARAKFLGTSDLTTLIAFTFHLLGMRDVYDTKTLWTLTGVATRIAEGMGVHRDGTALGLGIFESEMRRRVWWQLLFLDFRTAELVGSGASGSIGSWDVRVPINVDDEDIWPGGDFAVLWDNFRRLGAVEEKEEGIKELERMLEQKYVRFCDPSIPTHFMAIIVTRAATNGMRLMAHHPRRYSKDEDVPEDERQLCWSIACKLLELDSLVHSSKSLTHFKWHSTNYFQWHALIYVLSELRRLPLQEQADRGWQIVHEVFGHHHEVVVGIKKPLNLAVGSLCLKAWKARTESWSLRQYAIPLVTPDYIERLRADREEKKVAPIQIPLQSQTDYFSLRQSRRPETKSMPTSTNSNLNRSVGEHNESMQSDTLQPQTSQAEQPQYYQQPQTDQPPFALHFPYQDNQQQQPQLFWWDLQQNNSNGLDTTMEFNMDSFADTMDWSQWDFLLKSNRPAG